MNPKPTPEHGPWLLILGLLIGASLLVVMMWDSFTGKSSTASASPHLVEFNNDNWQKEVINSDVPVLVDFTAEWCGPCKKFAPIVNKLADRYQGKVKVGKFDVGDTRFDKATKLAQEYQLGGVPHVIIFKGGEPRYNFEGGRSEAELAEALDKLLQ